MPETVLIDQILTVVELLDGGPAEFLAPDLVLLPAPVETVLGTITSHQTPGAPLSERREGSNFKWSEDFMFISQYEQEPYFCICINDDL